MKQMMLIGDVHGKWIQYADILKAYQPECSVQVGDFGIGFSDTDPEYVNYLNLAMETYGGNNRFIRGNHDNPAACREHPKWIPDATFDESIGVFYLGGALSIDKEWRIEGEDWWRDEELSYIELDAAISIYESAKPRIVVSHECPEDVVGQMMPWYDKMLPSRTRDALNSMFSLHKPQQWVFGHWHSSVSTTVDGCQFTCLNELEHMMIEL